MKSVFVPKGVCSRKIELDIQDGKIIDLKFTGGCPGNLAGIERLAKGQDAKYIAQLLQGTTCGGKGTSCPDQLSKAIMENLEKQA